jgi:proteinaceous RNase P
MLPLRHLAEDRLPEYARPIIAGWRKQGQLYSCALRNNDDWYWLYAAVKSGERSLLVSNDEMRDHHFGMWVISAVFNNPASFY